MAQVELIMPKMGESVAEATIIKWLKEEGDRIEMDEPVLEIATDKVDSEVPSPVEGFLSKRLFAENDVVQVGQAIAMISTEAGEAAPVPAVSAPAPAAAQAETMVAKAVETIAAPAVVSNNGKFYSPLVRSIAQKEGIAQSELDALAGTGMEGRVTKKDILSYVSTRGAATQAAPVAAPATPAPQAAPQAAAAPIPKAKPAVSINAGDEIIEMDRMRKLIAEHMVMSKHTSPHVTSFVEADMTNIVMWRNKVKDAYKKREGENLTFTPIFIQALTKAIKDFPMINISVDGDRLIRRKSINIGMAAALPSGNLIVPVIKDADMFNLSGLTKKVNDLANRARLGQLTPDEISGGTYTLTNVGSFGNVMGTPIINQPQVAIMAVGAIRKKPAVVETPEGDFIGIRHMMFLSHSYDHRVVDGSLGGMFVRRVADYLEQFDPNQEI
jgi:2-oxoglutarate dehydrogenase E2 component (dihydrolipoamide succinyltransferase)